MTDRISPSAPGYTEPQQLIREVADLIREANIIAGRWSLTADSDRERAAFRARKVELLERLNFASAPTIIASQSEATR